MQPVTLRQFFGEHWPAMLAPFEGFRDRFPELNDEEFESDVAEPLVAEVITKFSTLLSSISGATKGPGGPAVRNSEATKRMDVGGVGEQVAMSQRTRPGRLP